MLARRIASLVLLVYPRPFRDRFGESLIETFELATLERRGVARAAFVVRSAVAMLVSGLKERVRPAAHRRPPKREASVGVSARGAWLANEARIAFRTLVKRPAFSVLIVVTLAVGFGGNVAIFSVVNAVLLEPMPFDEPERIITVAADWRGPEAGIGGMSYPDIADIESEARTVTTLVGVNRTSMTLAGLGETRVIEVGRVTKGLLPAFGVAPIVGRDLTAEEFGVAGPTVAVLSFGFWQAHFGGAEDALGKTFRLGDFDYEIVGVAPAQFDYPTGVELWIPSRLDPSPESCGRGCHTMAGVGRLADGASLEQANLEVSGLAAGLEEAFPDTNTHKGFLVRALSDQRVADVRSGLLMLLGAVGLVLLIACANVANLLLARASTRRGEVAIRTALGAGRAHLVAQTLVESFLFALTGGIAGLGLAKLVLLGLPYVADPLPGMETVAIDRTVLMFSAGSIVLTTFLFGLAPAFSLLRSPVRAGLLQAVPGSTGETRGKARFRRALLAGEVAVSALLLIGAALLLESFVALHEVDVGFQTENVFRFNVLLPEASYDTGAAVAGFYRQLEDRLEALPGVEAVGSVWGPPLGRGRATGNVIVSGRPEPPPELEREAAIHSVSPNWLETMRIRLVVGRRLDARDDLAPAPVAVVNETFVRHHFPNEDPIGREVEVTVDLGYGSPKWRIVGVIADVLSRGLTREPESQIYVPQGMFGPENMTVTLRLSPDAPSPLPAARAIVAEMEPLAPIYRVETVEQALERHVAPTRFYLILTGAFAFLAALLAAVGLYGVVSESSAERTRELGLRLALGARAGSVRRLVLVQGMGPTLIGLVIGLSAAFFGGKVMESVVFAVDTRDPWAFVGSSVLLVGVALVASFIPARRASRLDPVRALKFE